MFKALVLLLLVICIGDISVAHNDTDYRLPRDIIPTKYDLYFFPVFDNNTFYGIAKIAVTSDKFVSSIRLHADLNVTEVLLKGVRQEHSLNKGKGLSFLDVRLKQQMQLNDILEIHYNGVLRDDMDGLYLSTYNDKNGTQRKLVATKFEPTFARKAFPCFDEPNFKATFNLTVKRKSGMTTLANTRLIGTDKLSNGYFIDRFETSPIMSTYLLAFVVSDFKGIESQDGRYGVFARTTALNQLHFSFSLLESFMDRLNTFTGINYFDRMSKIHMVAVPDFLSGAMENWGLVTYRETYLLYDPTDSTPYNKQRIARVIAHEMSHMWFGNLVTLDWWDYVWLNEGFARYCDHIIVDEVYPHWLMQHQFLVNQMQDIMITDSFMDSMPLTNKVFNPVEIKGNFRSISYAKGASILRMLHHVVGNESFVAGIRNYLKQYAGKNTVPVNLWNAMEEKIRPALPGKLSTIMHDWTDKPGYPVLNVTRRGTDIVLSQQRFVLSPSSHERSSWYIPLTYATKSLPNFTNTMSVQWLEPSNSDVVLSNVLGTETDWIIFNIQETGYYRVNYDNNLWDAIHQLLSSDHDSVHVLNRAQIVDDVFNLARSGLVPYRRAFDVTSFLSGETSYFVWQAALRSYKSILKLLDGRGHVHHLLQTHLLDRMQKVLKLSSFENLKNLTEIETFRNLQILHTACELGDEWCARETNRLFHDFQSREIPIDSSLRKLVFCTALKNGDHKEWQFVWSQYLKTDIASKKAMYLGVLPCTTNQTMLSFLLEKAFSGSDIRSQDATSVFNAVSRSDAGIEKVYEFLTANFKIMPKRLGGVNQLGSILSTMAHMPGKEIQYRKLTDEILKEYPTLSIYVKTSLQVIEANEKWVEKNSEGILQYLMPDDISMAADKLSRSTAIGSHQVVYSINLPFILFFISLRFYF